MTIKEGDTGYAMDILTGDGMNLYENSSGEGWMVRDGLWMREVTQADMNKTKDMPNDFSLLEGLQAMSFSFASSMLLGMLGSMFQESPR